MSVGMVKRNFQPYSRVLRAVFVAVALFSATRGVSQEQIGGKLPSQSTLVAELQSPKVAERASAVHSLLAVPADRLPAPVRDQILKLYAAELEKWREALQGRLAEAEARERSQEAFAEYLAYLGTLVMRVGGEHAWGLLIDSPSQPMADSNRELAALGTRVLPLVLNRLAELRTFMVNTGAHKGPDSASQMAMADILGQMLVLSHAGKLRPQLSATDEASIRRGLRPYLSDSDLDVRFWAASALALAKDKRDTAEIRQVFAHKLSSPRPIERVIALQKLARVSDSAFIPTDALKKLAQDDPYNGPAPREFSRGPYPIRKQAEEILESLHATQ